MAVAPADLKSPIGKIDSAFFPGEATAELDARLQQYINEAIARIDGDLAGTELDDATKLWAYYRAFEAVHLRMIATPASVSIQGEGSVAYTAAQIASFGTAASDYLSAFNATLEAETQSAASIPSGSVATRVTF